MDSVLSVEGRDSAGRAVLVNRYAMPFAVATVALGVVLGTPEGWVGKVSIALLVFGAVFNVAAGRYLAADPQAAQAFIPMRMWINLACNGVIFWLLGSYWTPAWLLLALTPLAAAVYSSRGSAVGIASAVAVLLLARCAVQSAGTPLEWGEAFAYAAFVVLATLMVHELTRPPKTA